ncbi:MAG: LPXTG cell wall anchor domain-containing protein [Actinomycetota bacterium]|nr:LPXTG cell wall anchor domain-containing protein [Actinomycetota bacterium]MDQ3350647.1 LPXTG cell wall anchor domain-containing protein [Actinomycetota bacterium]
MDKRRAGSAPAIAGVLLLGSASAVDATTAPAQDDSSANEDDSSKVGLLGLVGLAGLAGLAGLKRRDNDNRYNNQSTSSNR